MTLPTPAPLPALRQMLLQPQPFLIREISPPHGHANDLNPGQVT